MKASFWRWAKTRRLFFKLNSLTFLWMNAEIRIIFTLWYLNESQKKWKRTKLLVCGTSFWKQIKKIEQMFCVQKKKMDTKPGKSAYEFRTNHSKYCAPRVWNAHKRNIQKDVVFIGIFALKFHLSFILKAATFNISK